MNGQLTSGMKWEVIGFRCGGAFVEVRVGGWVSWFGVYGEGSGRWTNLHGERVELN